jgi:hypothetical protein
MGGVGQEVKGTALMISQADEGMKLFANDPIITFDTVGASKFKLTHEARIKEIEVQAENLTGKSNKKARSEHGKQVQAMKAEAMYIDACKVMKGVEAPNGNFMTKIVPESDMPPGLAIIAPAPVVPEPKKRTEKEGKKTEAQTGGLSKEEKDELEKLREDIIARKAELKEQGLSGGQCNKDSQVQKWVARMQELKIKENPLGLGEDGKKEEKKKEKKVSSAEKLALEKKLEEYKNSLRNDFGYTEKDIKADPDFQDLQKELAKMK